MLVAKQNVTRIEVEVGCFNPHFDKCLKHNETGIGADGVIDAFEWEFEAARQSELFNKIRNNCFEFKCFNTCNFSVQYYIEYVTKTSYFD